MTIFLTGGSASGKSDWAEGLAVALHRRMGTGPLLYLATMSAEDDESLRRVVRHRERRAGKGFTTIERPVDLAGLSLPDGAAVLLEDLGNLTANELYSPDGGGEAALIAGLESLLARTEHLIIVGNEVFADGEDWTGEMAAYLRLLARAHLYCAAGADAAGTVCCGIPRWQKRPAGDLFHDIIKEAEPR